VQLHEEADYRAEGARMTAYAEMLGEGIPPSPCRACTRS